MTPAETLRAAAQRLRDYLRGAAQVINLVGYANHPLILSDREAIEVDWRAVGDAMRRAIGTAGDK